MRVADRQALFGLAVILSLVLAQSVSAQSEGPYVSGYAGVSAGDGGGGLTAGGAVGYMMPRRLAFELEVSSTPDLDLGDLGTSNSVPTTGIIPVRTLDVTGRLIAFQTNATVALTSGGKLQVSVVGGGGVANLRQDLVYQFPDIVIPPLDPNNPVFLPIEVTLVERRVSRSENALCLNIGGIVDYALSRRISLGVDARYMHGFFNPEALKTGRVAARIRWQF
jgi:hypothetical protein